MVSSPFSSPEPYPTGLWEERWHPLREEWVINAAHRQNRPWTGAVVNQAAESPPSYQPGCYLCPGNLRVSGMRNPVYTSTYVFDNDHPCVGPEAPSPQDQAPPPYRSQPASGLSRVVCYSPDHSLSVAEMQVEAVEEVVRVWQQQTHDLGALPAVSHVLVFENKGEVVGVSNPHPHGQIYATSFVWKTVEVELNAQRRYRADAGRALFADILAAEQADGRRVLFEDEHTLAFVPFFARYAYEVNLAPRRRVAHITDLTDAEVESLARAIKDVTVRFDNLWQMPFPYVMPLHQAPAAAADPDFHFYIGFLPPLRRPDLLKFLAGPEIGGGNFLSDTSPEEKAAELRAQSTVHYRSRSV